MKNFKFESKGDLVIVSGDNWTYERIGELYVFTQTGKIQSIRVVKALIKLHLELSKA